MDNIKLFLNQNKKDYFNNGTLERNKIFFDCQKFAYDNGLNTNINKDDLFNAYKMEQQAKDKEFNDKYNSEMSEIFYNMYKKGTLNFN